MQKHRKMVYFILVLVSFSLVFVSGCATKSVVKDEEKQAIAEKKSAAETDAEKAAREKALKEAELREQERQLAEKEKAKTEKGKPASETAGISPLTGFEFIYFDYDKYAISPESRETLKKVADWLNANSKANLIIEGNADERGTAEYNLALGERRANSAKNYLADLGIDKNRISIISYGKEKPVDSGHTEEAWAKNRNAQFVVKK
jgi:peptidoglycan-associated lipoprotein